MPTLTFFHLITVFQFSDTKNYVIFESYTPNFIIFGCSGAELGPFEVAWLRVSEQFAISETGRKPARNARVFAFFHRSTASQLSVKI